MALMNRIKDFFTKYTPLDTDTIRENLPFVHLLGHEKQYGKPRPQDFSAMIEAYKSWVYACAWKNATTIAGNKPLVFKRIFNRDEEERLDRIYQHPFLDLINNVNPFSNKFELLTITDLNLELTGNAYWWIPKDALGMPYMLWNLPSHWMKIIPSPEEFISGYLMSVPGSGKFVPFDESEIVHFKFPSVFDLFYGSGPTWAAQFGIDLNQQLKTWGINFFMNNAQPSGALMTDGGLTPDQFERLKTQWNKRHRGSKNAGKMAILEAGLKYQQIGSKMKESGFCEMDKEIRNEIMAMFGVPASKLGLVEDVNRANADANDYTYQKETILPRLRLIEEKMNEKIAPIYDPNLVIQFDNPVPDDNDFRLKEKEINIRMGITSIDEEREKDGLEPLNLPETSTPLIPFNMVPSGQVQSTSPAPVPEKNYKSMQKAQADAKWEAFARLTTPQEKLLESTMKRYFQKQHSEVMNNVNNFKALKKDLFSSIIFALTEANQVLQDSVNGNVRQAYESGLTLGASEVESTIDFNLFEPNIVRAVNARTLVFAQSVNESTQKLIKNEITLGIENGESIERIGGRIDGVFQHSERFRSKRIAQTEVIGATNEGQLRAYSEAGVTEKEWLTARDESVRDSHQIEGQIVLNNENFTTGAGFKLQYPGDRSQGAPAGEIINCRCTVLPVTKRS